MTLLNVRHLRADEADLHRQLRLEALRESPRAFGDTLESLEHKDADYWNALTQRVCSVDAMVVALDVERPIGMIYGLQDRQIRQGARLGGVWVDAQYRRRGAGTLLVHNVIGWAQSQAFVMARLWVGHDEGAAIALYERCGFVFTGVARALEERPSIVVREMRRALA
ncbi:GNAT family N-acetyltransferase [Variovorax sp. J31P179]|uniref:GNAT family N-acetyltransferase n=1 Tax=Variovorax sp. J31P179 TaxID=3053508 RepID=UPI002577136A|nr:GNAT family N-acetyltransferase [Variovorax sp. J31P179]MDM0084385.1 GNAT family N-acetyltransferase [Variovorax sp. J31P179]